MGSVIVFAALAVAAACGVVGYVSPRSRVVRAIGGSLFLVLALVALGAALANADKPEGVPLGLIGIGSMLAASMLRPATPASGS